MQTTVLTNKSLTLRAYRYVWARCTNSAASARVPVAESNTRSGRQARTTAARRPENLRHGWRHLGYISRTTTTSVISATPSRGPQAATQGRRVPAEPMGTRQAYRARPSGGRALSAPAQSTVSWARGTKTGISGISVPIGSGVATNMREGPRPPTLAAAETPLKEAGIFMRAPARGATPRRRASESRSRCPEVSPGQSGT